MDLQNETNIVCSAPREKSLAGMRKGRPFDPPTKDFLSDCDDRTPDRVESVVQDVPAQIPP